MKTFQKLWHKKGLLVFIYLDDILILGKSFLHTQKATQKVISDLQESGMVINFSKSTLVPVKTLDHLGFTINFQTGCLEVPPQKTENCQKGTGEIGPKFKHDPQKNGSHLGGSQEFSHCHAFFKGLHWGDASLCPTSFPFRLGCKPPHTPLPENTSARNSLSYEGLEGKIVFGESPRQNFSHRFLQPWVGWGGIVDKGDFARFLEARQPPTYKCKRTQGSSQHCAKPWETRGLYNPLCGQSSHLFLPQKGGGRLQHFNCHMQDLWKWQMANNAHIIPQLVKSSDCQADHLSRVWDRGIILYTDRFLHR